MADDQPAVGREQSGGQQIEALMGQLDYYGKLSSQLDVVNGAQMKDPCES